jgi:hypothetical protein
MMVLLASMALDSEPRHGNYLVVVDEGSALPSPYHLGNARWLRAGWDILLVAAEHKLP